MASFTGITLNSDQIDFILGEQEISGTDAADTVEQKTAIKTALYYQIPLIISGLQNVTEGGYSISWNTSALLAWYRYLAAQLGLPDALADGAVIRDKSNRW